MRIFNPNGLPVKDDVQQSHPKVQELRQLSLWSDGHVWCSPEQHGNLVRTSQPQSPIPYIPQSIYWHSVGQTNPHTFKANPPHSPPKTAVFKNQIDWIPLSTGSVRPTQGRTLALVQVSGGSQSFNTVNSLRMLGRWMRMFTIPNQSSLPKAYTQFTTEGNDGDEKNEGRLMPSSNRDRLVDVMEELVKYTLVMRPHLGLFADRYSERQERREKMLAKEEEKEKEREVEASM